MAKYAVADWNSVDRRSDIVGDTSSPTQIRGEGKYGQLTRAVTGITEQLAEMRMIMPRSVRRTPSIGPGAAADTGGEPGGGMHTVAGAGTSGPGHYSEEGQDYALSKTRDIPRNGIRGR